MINLSISELIYRPINEVFDFVSAPENDFQWQYGTLESSAFAEGASTVGTFFRSVGHLMGRRNLSTFEVTEYEPNRKYGFKTLSGPLYSQTSYALETVNGGTKINIFIQAYVINFFQVNEGILEKNMKKQLKDNLAMLKNLLEGRRIPAASRIDIRADGNFN